MVWKEKQIIKQYECEVEVIEFVERNANYIILGITALCIAFQTLVPILEKIFGKTIDIRGFYLFIILALIFSIGGVLPLLWKPEKEGSVKDLVLLRHWKTIWYTFSVGFFLASAIALFLSLPILQK